MQRVAQDWLVLQLPGNSGTELGITTGLQFLLGWGALAGLVTGAIVVAAWIALGWNKAFLGGEGLYEILPGFVASWFAIWLVSKATAPASESAV